MRVSVVVLGDLGRSPRMVYHALALADRDVDVDLIGYAGELPSDAAAHPRIRCHVLEEDRGVTRIVSQARRLLRACLNVPKPDVFLLQIPPSLPALAVVVFAARRRGARVVVDWHNLTSSMLALRIGRRRLPLWLVDTYERFTAHLAGAHFCVSEAMATRLRKGGGLERVRVFRDRPAERFAHASEGARERWTQTLFHERAADNCLFVAVPSSWSLDDDFDLLLEAIERCEATLEEEDPSGGRWIGVVLTGRGERRADVAPRFETRRARRVHARAVWCSPDEYVELIGCVDLGVSIHRSASGLDLPMKICDLFGAGAPVCALDYGPCLGELVQDGVNGLLFKASADLARQLSELALDGSSARLTHLRAGASASAAVRWKEGWLADAWPILRGETHL